LALSGIKANHLNVMAFIFNDLPKNINRLKTGTQNEKALYI